MGSDSGRPWGAGLSSLLGVLPALGALVLPSAGRGGTSSRPPWGLLGYPAPRALTEEAQLPEPSGYKTDGDQRRCQQTARAPFTKSNLFLFPSPSSSRPPSHPSPFLQLRLAVTLMPGRWCGTARALKVALISLGGSAVGRARGPDGSPGCPWPPSRAPLPLGRPPHLPPPPPHTQPWMETGPALGGPATSLPLRSPGAGGGAGLLRAGPPHPPQHLLPELLCSPRLAPQPASSGCGAVPTELGPRTPSSCCGGKSRGSYGRGLPLSRPGEKTRAGTLPPGAAPSCGALGR